MGLQPFTGHLKNEITLYKELISILHKETENLVNRDYKGLYDTVAQKEHILTSLEALGRVRVRLMHDAAVFLGIEGPGEANLSAIIECAGEEKEELSDCQSTILSLIEGIKEINKVNSLVVKGSLENINKTLGFLGNFMPASTYKPSGAFDGGLTVKGSRFSEGA